MSVHAAVTGDLDLLKLPVLHEPLVGAICSPDEVWQMVDEMVVAQAKWLPQFAERGITVNPFKPANSRFLVHWSPIFRDKFAGTPVKNVALTYAGKRVRGELMISRKGSRAAPSMPSPRACAKSRATR